MWLRKFFFPVLLLLGIAPSLWADMHQDVEYLASDALEGRQAGTRGGELATQYITRELQLAGVGALGDSYQQKFTIFTGMEKNGENSASFVGEVLASKFQPLSYSSSGSMEDDIIFAGYGISIPANDPQLHYDDYEGLDVTGKIVMVLTADPGVGNAQSLFRRPEYINYRSLNYKLNNAIKHGAKGFILVQDPLSLAGQDENDPRFNALEGGGYRFEILAGQVTISWANQLMSFFEMSVLDWQRRVVDSQAPFSFSLKEKVKITVNLQKKVGQVVNVLGFIPGNDEKLKREVVVIGAHFDHLGYGASSSREGNSNPVIHNGADDNASGTAMVLELARELTKHPGKRSIVFAFFNGEEIGLLGSHYFVENWKGYQQTFGDIKAMLNFDMVGRYQKTLDVMAISSGLEWAQIFNEVSSQGLNLNLVARSVGSSDHASFTSAHIPALFFTTGTHDDYHRSTDDTERINFEAMGQILALAKEIVAVTEGVKSFNYNPDFPNEDLPGGNRGYGSHLGCVPDFGQDESIVGVLCSKATANSPAEQAGIIPGDIIVQLGEIEIKNIYDLVFVLKFYRPGDRLKLFWLRQGQKMSADLVLAPPSGH